MAVNDEIFKNLEVYGGGTINERVYNFLGSLGYTGTINDRLGQFEEGGRKGWQGLIRAWGQWAPAQLFSQGQQGVWYEPRPEYLFQDAAGTTPVTADGDPVGYIQDLSGNGNHATQSTSAARPIYRTDGVRSWSSGDGVDDSLLAQTPSYSLATSSALLSIAVLSRDNNYSFGIGNGQFGANWLGVRTTAGGSYELVIRQGDGIFAIEESAVARDASPHIMTLDFDGLGFVNWFIDGSQVAVIDISAGLTVSALSFHSLYRDAPSNWSNSDICGGLLALADDKPRVSVESYLAKLAGVTL